MEWDRQAASTNQFLSAAWLTMRRLVGDLLCPGSGMYPPRPRRVVLGVGFKGNRDEGGTGMDVFQIRTVAHIHSTLS